MARYASARASEALLIDLRVHGAQAVDDQRGVELMHGVADGGLDNVGRAGDARVDLHAGGMVKLQIGAVDRRSDIGAKVLVPDVAHHADDGGVELGVGAAALGNHAAKRILRRAEDTCWPTPHSPRPLSAAPWRQTL